jgi:hypothetical protein
MLLPVAQLVGIAQAADGIRSVPAQGVHQRGDRRGCGSGARGPGHGTEPDGLLGVDESSCEVTLEDAQHRPGLVLVAGGKYTTYRVMARDAVDAAVRHLPGAVPDSCTERVPLVGADGYDADWNRRHQLAEEHGLPVHRVEHLLHRYGSLVHDVLALTRQDPDLL